MTILYIGGFFFAKLYSIYFLKSPVYIFGKKLCEWDKCGVGELRHAQLKEASRCKIFLNQSHWPHWHWRVNVILFWMKWQLEAVIVKQGLYEKIPTTFSIICFYTPKECMDNNNECQPQCMMSLFNR